MRLQRRLLLSGIAAALLAAAFPAFAESRLKNFSWTPDGTALVFKAEFADKVVPKEHDLLVEKDYWYVDFYGAEGPEEPQAWDMPAGFPVRHVKRFTYPKQNVVRLVFYTRDGQAARLTIEGLGREYRIRAAAADSTAATLPARPSTKKGPGSHKLVIIDPGHGGVSSGAQTSSPVGGQTYYEKDLVLQIALKMVPLFEKSPNLECRLTRSDDTYVSLNDRITFADKAKGDLFVSIHMNATDSRHKTARGTEIYYLSDEQKAANRELERLENERGEKLEATGVQGAEVKAILADLSNEVFRRRRQESAMAALVVDQTLQKEGPFRGMSRGVKDAGFRVLMNSNMPSILCEVGYIDNSQDAAMMIQPPNQEALAVQLFNAINLFFSRVDPEFKGTLAPIVAPAQMEFKIGRAPAGKKP